MTLTDGMQKSLMECMFLLKSRIIMLSFDLHVELFGVVDVMICM